MADAPGRWNWVQGAMVPGPLTAEDEEKQRQKKAEKDKKLKVCMIYCHIIWLLVYRRTFLDCDRAHAG